MAPLSTSSLSVNGDNNLGVRTIGGNSSIAIEVVFQYRMTDYAGAGSAGNGRIGGQSSSVLSNLSYSKKIGIDLFDSQSNSFKFDLEVFAKYKA
jgi:hypothetical protein